MIKAILISPIPLCLLLAGGAAAVGAVATMAVADKLRIPDPIPGLLAGPAIAGAYFAASAAETMLNRYA